MNRRLKPVYFYKLKLLIEPFAVRDPESKKKNVLNLLSLCCTFTPFNIGPANIVLTNDVNHYAARTEYRHHTHKYARCS